MKQEDKDGIKEALEVYLSSSNMTQNEFAQVSEVNPRYIIAIRNGESTVGNTVIADKWYRKVANIVGYKIEKVYWEPKQTNQLLRIMATLEDARKYGYTNTIIGNTGSGKTYTTGLFAKKNWKDVFVVTIGSNDLIADVINKLMAALQVPDTSKHIKKEFTGQFRSKSQRITRIINHIKELKAKELYPMIVFDEAEYMSPAVLRSIKELYDNLKGICAIVLLGTDQLVDKIEGMKKSNKPGIPQFYSRIRFGIRYLEDINKNYDLFLESVTDKEVRKFIKSVCDDYREVHDLLVPAMREADRLDVPLTVDLLKKILGWEDC